MKELSIEEKAKAYDEALKVLHKYDGAHIMFTQDLKEEMFPELKESEDERIRKGIIKSILDLNSDWLELHGVTKENAIAWLEKQSNKNKIDYNEELKKCKANPLYFFDKYVKVKLKEQKLADKVEPKFHEGEWVTDGTSVFQIVKIESEWYIADDGERVCFDVVHQYYHLWTIQDAKVGDILFQDLMGGMTFIFDGVNPEMAILYSFIINNDGEDVLPYDIGKPNTGIGDIEENKNIIHPATKEQRDLLFQKMYDAGYEWDAEKKKLKKIE